VRVPDLSAIDTWPVEHAVAVALLPDGSTISHGDVDRPFRIASVTKVLTALAVLVATEDGTVGLGDSAGPPGATIAHLLAHASGLSPDSDEMLARPGERRIYSNRGFEVLGEILVERSGLTAAQWVAEAVTSPLGLTSTTLEGSPAHGASSTAADLGRVAADLLSPDPTLIASSTRDALTTVAFPSLAGVLPGFGSQDPNPWGLGVEIRGRKSPHWTPDAASTATFGHFGRAGTFIWCDPDRRVALVVLTDREFGQWAPPLWRSLGDEVLSAT
jgi:CubicO group peptidase (beta-lactamase class C family)